MNCLAQAEEVESHIFVFSLCQSLLYLFFVAAILLLLLLLLCCCVSFLFWGSSCLCHVFLHSLNCLCVSLCCFRIISVLFLCWMACVRGWLMFFIYFLKGFSIITNEAKWYQSNKEAMNNGLLAFSFYGLSRVYEERGMAAEAKAAAIQANGYNSGFELSKMLSFRIHALDGMKKPKTKK